MAKIAPRSQVGGGPYGVEQISGKLKNSWEEEHENNKHMNGAICGQFWRKKLLRVCDFFNSQKRPCPTLGCKLIGDFLKPQVEPTPH